MPIRIVLDRIGAPEVLHAIPALREQPGTGQVWLEHESIGVNYLDVTQRNGAVPIDLPSALGLEATGRVAVVGDGVSEVGPGLTAHISDVSDYRERTADLFDAIARRVVTPSIWRTYPLADVAAAHRALEDGSSHGAIVLDPQ
ncbi:zinc-binding dehydrogenase [Rhizorhabdus argentea]|uniref:zinc-binding dehydrogenase n=1 Tax=Rhizorhabdus argentea TaxID=1387174 RepID=UPI0030EEEEFC